MIKKMFSPMIPQYIIIPLVDRYLGNIARKKVNGKQKHI